MRLLSNVEKDLCNRILDEQGQYNNLEILIDDQLDNLCIAVTRSTKQVELVFTIQNQMPTNEETQAIIDRIGKISVLILTAVNLINMLEKEGYIMLLRRANQINDKSQFGQCVVNMPSVTHRFPDETVNRLLIDFTNKEIIPTDEFRRFCKRGYIARDEQRFLWQFRTTFAALVVAIAALCANIILNLMPKKGETRINQEQIDSVRTDLKSINNAIDTLSLKQSHAAIAPKSEGITSDSNKHQKETKKKK